MGQKTDKIIQRADGFYELRTTTGTFLYAQDPRPILKAKRRAKIYFSKNRRTQILQIARELIARKLKTESTYVQIALLYRTKKQNVTFINVHAMTSGFYNIKEYCLILPEDFCIEEINNQQNKTGKNRKGKNSVPR